MKKERPYDWRRKDGRPFSASGLTAWTENWRGNLLLILVEGVPGAGKSSTARLIYLRPADLAETLHHTSTTRGESWAARFIARATDCTYGRHRGLQGVDGMLTYWAEYQRLMDRLFGRADCPKLSVASGGAAWP